jgi:hypothetical protein
MTFPSTYDISHRFLPYRQELWLVQRVERAHLSGGSALSEPHPLGVLTAGRTRHLERIQWMVLGAGISRLVVWEVGGLLACWNWEVGEVIL